MANFSDLLKRQYGLASITSYEPSLHRLRCQNSDNYQSLYIENSIDNPIFTCRFGSHPSTKKLLALANEDGSLAVIDTGSPGMERMGTRAHFNAVFDIAWSYVGASIITASGDHTAKLFDLQQGEIKEIRTFYGHTRSVKSAAFRKEDPNVFATGGRDGNIMIWDIRTNCCNYIGKPDKQISLQQFPSTKYTLSHFRKRNHNPSPSLGTKSITGLVFRDDNCVISCTAGDGHIKLWDLRKTYSTHCKSASVIEYCGVKQRSGYSYLALDKECTRLYANCLDNTIYCFNVKTFSSKPVMKYKGHLNSTFFIKSAISPDGNYLISGSSDDCAYIWKRDSELPRFKLTGHSAEVTSVAWNESEYPLIVTCSDDMTHKFWYIKNEKEIGELQNEDLKGKIEFLSSQSTSELTNKRKCNAATPPSSKKYKVECQQCSKALGRSKFCENCNIKDGMKAPFKISPRRLFSNDNVLNDTTNLSQNIINLDLGNNRNSCAINSTPSTSKIPDWSPKLTSNSPEKYNNLVNSPTVDLPNFVVDGSAPHLNFSPPKKKELDWLTKLRFEKNFKKELIHSYECGYSSADISNQEEVSRVENSNPDLGKSSVTQSSLLRFFKVTNSNKSEVNNSYLGKSQPYFKILTKRTLNTSN